MNELLKEQTTTNFWRENMKYSWGALIAIQRLNCFMFSDNTKKGLYYPSFPNVYRTANNCVVIIKF